MPRKVVDLGSGQALLNIASYGRSAGRPLTPHQRLQIALTVRRAPEVMVKVSGGARSIGGVEAHFAYIGREGELGVETDYGWELVGKGFENKIVPNWDLDLWAHRRQDARSIRGTRRPAKLVHNVIFSMPPGTSPDKLLKAVRRLAENEFAMKHRYAMVLHTDETHPHVHLVVKAVSEQGERLNIRKATLRDWRQQFATHLRELGVAANATERAVRGQQRTPKYDAIYRAMQRNESTRQHKEVLGLAAKSADVLLRHRNGSKKLSHTWSEVIAGWHAIARGLQAEGNYGLANDVRFFSASMSPPETDQRQLVQKAHNRTRIREIAALERTR
jgi:Relaxase/Mobilisation nuclease domain